MKWLLEKYGMIKLVVKCLHMQKIEAVLEEITISWLVMCWNPIGKAKIILDYNYIFKNIDWRGETSTTQHLNWKQKK